MYKPAITGYKPYFQKYLDLVADASLTDLLEENTNAVEVLFSSKVKEKENFRYTPGKWTVKDVFMHLIDTERGFSYRAIVCIRRDDKTPLYPMDEDFYAANVDVSCRSMESLVEEFLAVRKAFALLFKHSSTEDLNFLGNAEDYKISARALGFIALGHTIHHMNVIKDRYL